MKIRLVFLLILAALVGVREMPAATRNPQITPNIVDESADASQDAGWVGRLQATLDEIQSKDGIRVLVQFHDQDPPDNEDQHAGDYMRALSAKLGVIQDGILMVHFAGDPDWRVWIGDNLTPKFVGKPGNAKGFTENGEMHEAKEAMLTAALAAAASKYDAMPNHPKADPKVAATGLYLRLQADAIVAGLKAKFGP